MTRMAEPGVFARPGPCAGAACAGPPRSRTEMSRTNELDAVPIEAVALKAVALKAVALETVARREVLTTGFGAIDALLPAGGVRRGSLIEWIDASDARGDALAELPAGGSTALACAVACTMAERSDGGAILVVDRRGWFHPPAVLPWLGRRVDVGGAVATGGRSGGLYVVRSSRDDDEVWAIDQALRCPGVAAVIGWPGRVHATALRRWQLAARSTGAVGLFVRPSYTLRDPTWAEARVQVRPVVVPRGDCSRADLATRRLRLSLVGGPWCGEETLMERTVDVVLDMCTGRAADQGAADQGAAEPAAVSEPIAVNEWGAHERFRERAEARRAEVRWSDQERIACRAS